MNILIVDSNYAFLSNCESTAFLYEEDDINIIKAQKLSGINNIIRKEHPDKIAVNAVFLDSLLSLDIDIPYVAYARTKADEYTLSESAVPSYGYVSSSDELLNAIMQDKVQNNRQSVKPKSAPKKPKHPQEHPQKPSQNPKSSKPKAEYHYEDDDILNDEDYDDSTDEDDEVLEGKIPKNVDLTELSDDDFEDMEFEDEPSEVYEKPVPHKAEHKKMPERERLSNTMQQNTKRENDASQKEMPRKPNSSNDFQARAREARKLREEEQKKKAIASAKTTPKNTDAEKQVDKDMGLVRNPAKVVTVYSSKGGVGKTTVACELATFLALTASGRGRLKVCLVDCNIDFGDVLNTLDFDVNGPCMMDWYSDIEVKAENGIFPSDITYTEDEITKFLQKKETDGLYALLAPMTNEDSMELEGTHIEIMLRNLIKNGGFDFIIIDTGNNTRDSSFIALQMAEIILMVLTQSTNTANCNASFLNAVEAMNRFGEEALDLNKIKLVINQIRPANSVGISVQELEDAFENPVTGRPYETYAKIKDSNDVRKASNNAEPLVYKSSSEFTRSIAGLASTLIGESHVIDAPKKKGFFARFRKG